MRGTGPYLSIGIPQKPIFLLEVFPTCFAKKHEMQGWGACHLRVISCRVLLGHMLRGGELPPLKLKGWQRGTPTITDTRVICVSFVSFFPKPEAFFECLCSWNFWLQGSEAG